MTNQLDPVALVTQDKDGNVVEVRLIARYMMEHVEEALQVTCHEVVTTWSCGTFHPSSPAEEDCR